MKQIIKNKKGLEDSIMTWIVASFIVLFAMLIYIFIVYGIGGLKNLTNFDEGIIKTSKNDFILTQSLMSFLNTPVNFNGKIILVKDLISGNPENEREKFLKFKELAEDFMDKNIISEKKVYETYQDTKQAWIRIYEINENPEQSYKNKYSDFSVRRGTKYSGLIPFEGCDPNSLQSFSFNLMTEGRKVSLCTEYL